ncbi:MAG: 3-oxoacyl-ACP reductase [Pseudonocardia sp. SCN 72-86]|nr:MAG: 3-oxoacyl-ACP reductase [Pseudonocardia sp. SCN 72-86]
MLAGRVAMVTGAGQGLGFAIAERLLAEGAAVAVVDVDAGRLDVALDRLRGSGGTVTAFEADLREVRAVRALPDRVAAHFGRLDILINNAGIRAISPVLDHSLDDWTATLEVNLTAPYLLIQGSVPHMRRQGRGAIVNIGSVASRLSFGERAAYNVSKAGLDALTRSVALELAASGIRCNTVAPGVIATPLNEAYVQSSEFADVVRAHIPAGAVGRPADIAGAVAYLCGDDSGYVNGSVVTVDGGWSVGKGY